MDNKQKLIVRSFFLLCFNCILIFANAQAWIQEGQDIDGEAESDQSGYSVSLSSDGSIVAIGARDNDGTATEAGHVRIYENINGTWTQIGQDIDGEAIDDRSGTSLSLSSDGSIVAIGAPYNDGSGTDEGHVRIYQNIAGTWTQIGQDIDGESTNSRCGTSVSLSSDGSIVAVGTPSGHGAVNFTGHVKIYQYSGGIWTQIGANIDGEAAYEYFGSSVSLNIDGSILAVGARDNGGTGSYAGFVRMYRYGGGSWTQLGADIDGEAAGDESGYSVSLSSVSPVLAVGAPYNDGNGGSSGHARIYRYSGTWTQIGQDIDGEALFDQSGYSVSLSSDGSIVAIGAPYNSGSANEAGHVRIYQNIAGTWTQIGQDIDGEALFDRSGSSVSLSSDGSTVAIGAVENNGSASSSGHVRIYKLFLPIVITSQPTNQINICAGTIIDYSVTGENIDTYQWQVSTNGGSSWSDLSDGGAYSGVTTGTLSVIAYPILDAYQYRCYVSNAAYNSTSDAATLTVIFAVGNPVPADLAVDVSINQVLSWDAATGALSYDVYFGEAGFMSFIGNQDTLDYDPGVLNYSTEHKWQILPVTATGTAVGCDIWTFTTEVNPGPPAEGGISVNDNGAAPNVYAILDADISTHNKGILIPRLSSTQRTGLTGLGTTEEGLTVYDTNTNSFWLWDGAAWKEFTMSAKTDAKILKLEKKIEAILNRLNDLEKK